MAESSYFATFADSSCCVALSASVLALSAKKIQKVTIKFALFQLLQLFTADTLSAVLATFSRRFAERMLLCGRRRSADTKRVTKLRTFGSQDDTSHQLSGDPPIKNTQLWNVRSQCTLVVES